MYYTFIGDPPDTDYKNRFSISPGLGRMLTRETLAAVFYEYSTTISSGDDPQLISLLLQHSLRESKKAYAMFDIGLNDGAADYGLLVGGSMRF